MNQIMSPIDPFKRQEIMAQDMLNNAVADLIRDRLLSDHTNEIIDKIQERTVFDPIAYADPSLRLRRF